MKSLTDCNWPVTACCLGSGKFPLLTQRRRWRSNVWPSNLDQIPWYKPKLGFSLNPTEYERLIERIVEHMFQEINPLDASNVCSGRKSHVDGASGFRHQIDVQIREKSDLYLIECKCWNRSISVGSVLAFVGRLKDIEAHHQGNVHGTVATTVGFQSGANKIASYFGVDLARVQSESEFALHFKGHVWHGIGGVEAKAEVGQVRVTTKDRGT